MNEIKIIINYKYLYKTFSFIYFCKSTSKLLVPITTSLNFHWLTLGYLSYLNKKLVIYICLSLKYKAKLLDSYCLDVYGFQLWIYHNFMANMMLICFYTAWRKSIRRLWKIPNTTHCNLLSSINSSVPIVINLERRCANFICSYLNSDTSIVKKIQLLNRPSAVVYQILEIIIDISVISII